MKMNFELVEQLNRELEADAVAFCVRHFPGETSSRAEVLAVALRQAVYEIVELRAKLAAKEEVECPETN